VTLYNPLRSIRHAHRYRQIVAVFLRHGFGSVFDHLGLTGRPWRRILQRSPDTSIPPFPESLAMHLRLALEELGPTFVKFGQILSTRPDLLPLAYISELSKLQDAVPPVPWELIRETLTQELGKAPEEVFAVIDPQPMASASLAQVHAATLLSGEEVVVKVQRPNIYSVISTDLEILSALALRLQASPWGSLYDFVGIANDFAFTLHNELDYIREARNAELFRANFAHEKYLYLPKIFQEFSTKYALTMERIRGIKIDDIAALDAAGYDRHRVALHCARIIIKEVLEDGFFHADPHPGNFVVMPGEVIGAMDFGMVGHLQERDRLNLIRLYLVSMAVDADSVVEEFIRMGAVSSQVDRVEFARDISRLLLKYHGLPLKAIRAREVLEEVMPIAFRYRLRLPTDLWLLGKTLAMMEGVGLQLDPDFDIFTVAEPFIQLIVWQLVLPHRGWFPALLRQGADWGEFLSLLPRAGYRLLDQAERGELFQLRLKDADQLAGALNRLATLLALSVLAAALIISLALAVPIAAAGTMRWLVSIGYAGLVIVGVWLLISIIRTRR